MPGAFLVLLQFIEDNHSSLFSGMSLVVLFASCIILMLRLDACELLSSPCLTFVQAAFEWLGDGGLLAVVSAYVIVVSYVQVSWHDECKRELRKSYRVILELAEKKPETLKAETWPEWTERQFSNFCVDFVSRARLLIAWSEDWPQGVLGVALVLRYVGLKGFGFAGISAAISVGKGVLIPVGQSLIFEYKKAAVEKALDDLVFSAETRQRMVETLPSPPQNSPIDPESVGEPFNRLMKKHSDSVLKRLNVADSELYRPLRDWLQQQWFKDLMKSERHIERFRVSLVEHYLNNGAPVRYLYQLGHMKGKCKLAGFKASDCKELANFTAEMCKKAKFTVKDCTDAGFSLSQCKEAGFTVKHFKNAGFTATQCAEAGFSQDDLEDVDFTTSKQWEDAGIMPSICSFTQKPKVAYDLESDTEDSESEVSCRRCRRRKIESLE